MDTQQIDTIRSFNRFYTGVIGLLDEYLLSSAYTLPEARVLFELSGKASRTSSDLVSSLRMDKGYLSRILRRFERKQLISKQRSETDARAILLTLSPLGRQEFDQLNRRSHRHIEGLLEGMNIAEREQLVAHMQEVQRILSAHEVV